MDNKVAKVFTIIAGVVFILTGIFAFFSPGSTVIAMSLVWTISFVVSGISCIISFVQLKGMPGRTWLLLTGVVSVILGIMLIGNGIVASTVSYLIFVKIFIIFMGITNIVGSIEAKDFGYKKWWVSLSFGLLLLLMGCSSAAPIFSASLITTFVSLGLVIAGVAFLRQAFAKSEEE